MEASHVELLALFQRAQAGFTDRVDAVEAGQWDRLALPDWTVADLVAHLVCEQLWVSPLLAGESLASIRTRVPAGTEELLDGDPLRSWEDAADAALTSWAAEGAIAGTVELTAGPTPAVEHLVEMTVELTVHTWDLAAATGGDVELDAELVAAGLHHAQRRLGPDGIPGLIDPALDVPSDADPQTRLLARFGRRC